MDATFREIRTVPTEDQQRAEVEQRTREAMAVEMAALRADSERARWCEENRARVSWSSEHSVWLVSWLIGKHGEGIRCHPDRNAAIDAAMKGGR